MDGHELAVLAVLAGAGPLSQVAAVGRLGVDRTTMVSLIDGLEDHGLVARRRSTPGPAPLDEGTAATLIRALWLLTWEDRAADTPG